MNENTLNLNYHVDSKSVGSSFLYVIINMGRLLVLAYSKVLLSKIICQLRERMSRFKVGVFSFLVKSILLLA